MKIGAVIQARMGSSRLPGKVLADLAGAPMLAHVVGRARRASRLDDVIVATSVAASDDAVAEWCAAHGVACVRGSEADVLDRYHQAAMEHGLDAVVRLTADCPLLDPAVVDAVVAEFASGDYDYVSNTQPPTFPDGLDTEVVRGEALHRAWREAREPAEREHVTPFIWKRPETFRLRNVRADRDLSHLRWTVDEPADLAYVRALYARLPAASSGGHEEVVMLVENTPDMRRAAGDAVRNDGYYKTLFTQAEAGAAPKRPLTESDKWMARAGHVIPGRAQTFSKGYTQFVQGVSPVFLARGKGAMVWDVDGNEYIDYIQGLLPNILGYAHDEVNAAAARQLGEGHSFSMPHPLEVELAERLTRIIPSAEMVRFAKNGSDATAGAVRAARAFTGRERVADRFEALPGGEHVEHDPVHPGLVQGGGEVADGQRPGRVWAAEERLHVGASHVGEVGTPLVRRDASVVPDRPQQRHGQGARAHARLGNVRTGEDVGHVDDLPGVLGVDHGRAARHGQDVVGQQWAQRQVGDSARRRDSDPLGPADEVVVGQRALVGVEVLARDEGDGLQAAFRVGELHPVALGEGPAAVGRPSGQVVGHGRRSYVRLSARSTSAVASTP